MEEEEQIAKLKTMLTSVVDKTYAETPSLMEHKGMEQAIAFRIGLYLQGELNNSDFQDVCLDCEYNKLIDRPKITPNYPNGIRPDLIIHRRGDHAKNLLAVEIKGWWNKDHKDDFGKLVDLTSREYDYQYMLGVFIDLQKEVALYRYFRSGAEETADE